MSEPLLFASYNIHKGVGTDGVRDAGRVMSVLREIDADVIALQEADQRFGQRASVLPRAMLDDSPWKPASVARRARSIGYHGNALLIRRDLEVLDAAPLDIPTLEPRGAACALLRSEGRVFRVIGTHLDLSGLRRSDQIRAILRHVERSTPSCPTILLGDFNQWTLRWGAIRRFTDGWEVCAPGPSFPSRRPIARLDRAACSPGWKIVRQGVHHSHLSAEASDHLPIWISAQIARTAW